MNKHGWKAACLVLAMTALAPLAQAEEAAAVAAPATVGEADIGYTLGYSLGQRMGADYQALDTKAFHEGFLDAFAGKPGRLDQAAMQAAFEQFQARRVAAMEAQLAKLSADNLAKANEFLKSNGKRKGVKTLKSGLQYEVLQKGKGASPKITDLVTAHYRGTLADGTEFDSSFGSDPVEFPLERVIAGWQEGVQLMNKGAKFKLFVPPALGYGEQGAGQAIGPNEALVFEVELIDFRAPPAPGDDADGAAEEPAEHNHAH